MYTFDDIAAMTEDEEPLPNWTWRIVKFPTFGSISLSPKMVKSCSLPLPKFSPRSKTIGATTVTSAGMSEVDAFDLILQENQKVSGLKYINNWMANIQDPNTGGYYLPSRYKKNIEIVLFNILGEPILNATLKNVWPTTIQSWELNSESGFRELSVNFACDATILDFLV